MNAKLLVKLTGLAISLVLVVWVYFYVQRHDAEVEQTLGQSNWEQRDTTKQTVVDVPPISVEKQAENELAGFRAKLEVEQRDGMSKLNTQAQELSPEAMDKFKSLRRTFSRSIAGRYSRKQIHLVVQAMREMLSENDNEVFASDQNVGSIGNLSWRVHLLPYIGEKHLYDQFHLDESWDSEHNLPLADQMPSVYRGYFDKPDATTTRLMTIDHPDAIGRGGRLVPLTKIKDPHSDTLAIIIVGTKHAVPWTSPDDFVANDSNEFFQAMQLMPKPTYWVGTIEGAALDVRFDGAYETFQSLATIDGGEANAVDAMIKEKSQLMKADK